MFGKNSVTDNTDWTTAEIVQASLTDGRLKINFGWATMSTW